MERDESAARDSDDEPTAHGGGETVADGTDGTPTPHGDDAFALTGIGLFGVILAATHGRRTLTAW